MEHKSFSLGEFKALEETGTFEAIVAVFGNVDHGGDRIQPGAFKRTLNEWRSKGRGVPILWSHDSEQPPIGVAEDLSEVKEGLKVKRGRLFVDDNPVARSVYAAMKGGALPEFSFGYGVPQGGAQRVVEEGKTIRELVDVNLGEVSPVFRGMNPKTRLIGVKSFSDEIENLREQREELDRKISELEEARAEIPEEAIVDSVRAAVEGAVGGQVALGEQDAGQQAEQEDKPQPNPTEIDLGEEALARIRSLQTAKPMHLE